MKKVVHAACPHDCPDACGVVITVEDGRATRIQGDPAHPITRGFLCAKVAKYLDRVYSPQRVLYPMRRVAPKGTTTQGQSGQLPQTSDFERITWKQALEEITERFKDIVAEFGSEAILPLLLRRHSWSAQRCFHGSPILSSIRSVATGPQYLFGGRRSW